MNTIYEKFPPTVVLASDHAGAKGEHSRVVRWQRWLDRLFDELEERRDYAALDRLHHQLEETP